MTWLNGACLSRRKHTLLRSLRTYMYGEATPLLHCIYVSIVECLFWCLFVLRNIFCFSFCSSILSLFCYFVVSSFRSLFSLSCPNCFLSLVFSFYFLLLYCPFMSNMFSVLLCRFSCSPFVIFACYLSPVLPLCSILSSFPPKCLLIFSIIHLRPSFLPDRNNRPGGTDALLRQCNWRC